MILLDGKQTSAIFKKKISEEVAAMKAAGKRAPHLAAVLVGNDGASETYVASKERNCKDVGFDSTLLRFDSTISEKDLLDKINELNNDDRIDGFIVQLPLPKHIDEKKITDAVRPSKDVDGFHPVNVGRMQLQQPCFVSATPKGIMMLLEHYKIETNGKHCVVIGRSNIVGSPMSVLLSRKSYPGNCTVTLCHSATKDLSYFTRQADIIIAALGKPQFLKKDMVKEGVVIIDVGITRTESSSTKSGYKIVGDVDFDDVAPKCSYITPVPGGVGLMTIIGLLQNTLIAAKKEILF
ncbi:MAG: tetrahydrofolate dehydrogenase/cyclohydrolase catalytic domain-containing protein [Bacteroidia bacterium]